MNVKLLRKIQKHILAHPKELNMTVIAEVISKRPSKTFKPGHACGTAACIDGLAQLYSGRITPTLNGNVLITSDNDFRVGREILELDYKQAKKLFVDPVGSAALGYDDAWPLALAEAYAQAYSDNDHKLAAQITVARIEVFILTDGAL